MQYIIADKQKAARHGFSGSAYLTRGRKVCINEKDLANAPNMTGSIEDRARQIDGEIMSLAQARSIMNRK